MSREKQIEEMARIASKCIISWLNNETPKALPNYIAEALCNAGYRKQSKVAMEIFDEIEQNFEIGYGGVLEFRRLLAELKKKYTEG